MKNDLLLRNVSFSNVLNWTRPILPTPFLYQPSCVYQFDHNGYDLTPIERMYSRVQSVSKVVPQSVPRAHAYRGRHAILKTDWFTQPKKKVGYLLNHSMLLERKGYSGPALDQLRAASVTNPSLLKLIMYQSKWGLDVSIDYVRDTHCFELFHYEYDGFDRSQLLEVKERIERLLTSMDMDDTARRLLARKSEWYGLEFFQQSQWKTRYFGLEPERFKMVGWQK